MCAWVFGLHASVRVCVRDRGPPGTPRPPRQVRTCELAGEWRQRFKEDVVVDLVCYRWGGFCYCY